MSNMINFGIDLGTTNSLIAKFNKGTVDVFKHPLFQGEEILPSVVSFRSDKIVVGKKAREYAERDPKNVISRFKRKMGTTESYKIKSLEQSKTPIELSAIVLKELKTFIQTGETPESVVITIPACFDMIQSNATKEAGYAAGFKQVVLLQEPIAASLAYANKEKNIDLKNSQWIVYDLGGGTFDVALVKIIEGELKIIDHEGNNYLGGTDFDTLIVENIIVPKLNKKGNFKDLLAQMKSESGKYNALWYKLLRLAEEAKIALSAVTSNEIEFSIEDDIGKEIDCCIPIARSEFEALIKETVDKTAELLKKILVRNSFQSQDLKFILMVGGSTYIPFVRKRIEELLSIPVKTEIDPTNAIVIGSAYFAATKEIQIEAKKTENLRLNNAIRIKVAYNRVSQEKEEVFAAKIEGETDGLFYRIIRNDRGYDSGLKKLTTRIQEDLPLREEEYNIFTFNIYDNHNNVIPIDFDSIQIAQGRYNVAGQVLPEDLSLVSDDVDRKTQSSELIFARNTILPAKRKIQGYTASKTLIHGTEDEIRIIVVEGPSENHYSANKLVGHLVIKAQGLTSDIHKGTDIDLEFEVSESRDLRIQAYVTSSNKEYLSVFNPKYREVPVDILNDQIQLLGEQLEKEKEEAISNENYEVAEMLEDLCEPIKKLHVEAMLLPQDDITDGRYKLEDEKRKLSQKLHQLTTGKQIDHLRAEYRTAKDEITKIVKENGNDLEKRQLHEIIVREHIFLNTTNPQTLETEIDKLRIIGYRILRRTPDFLLHWFNHLCDSREKFNDQLQARSLIEAGKKHIEMQDYEKLDEVIARLFSLLPQQEQDSEENRTYYTGITKK